MERTYIMSHGEKWAEMMTMAQKGNAPMYNTLLNEISSYLTSYLKYKLRSADDVQDILQEILISIHRSRHTFDGSYPFKPWLFTITQSRLIEHWRRNKRRLEQDTLWDEEAVGDIIAEAEVSNLDINALQSALDKLSGQQQSILVGLKFDGKSIRELSVELSMSESAVKVAAHRAYKSVANELGMEI